MRSNFLEVICNLLTLVILKKTNGFNNNTNLFYTFLTNSQKCLNILTFMFTLSRSRESGRAGECESGKISTSDRTHKYI
jgi:hypothetical protein